MSRTYKDKRNYEFRHRDWQGDEIRVPYESSVRYWNGEVREWTKFFYLKQPTTKPKVKRSVDNEWHWLRATPSSWTNLFMNRPIRRKMQSWCRNVVKSRLDELDSLLEPSNSKKPHVYYW